LDGLGCYHERKSGGYRCHRGPLAGQSLSRQMPPTTRLRLLKMDDIDIYRSAKLRIDQYGVNPSIRAGMRAEVMLERGGLNGVSVWRRIMRASDELQATAGRTKPGSGTRTRSRAARPGAAPDRVHLWIGARSRPIFVGAMCPRHARRPHATPLQYPGHVMASRGDRLSDRPWRACRGDARRGRLAHLHEARRPLQRVLPAAMRGSGSSLHDDVR
jgi:hypothetical protein